MVVKVWVGVFRLAYSDSVELNSEFLIFFGVNKAACSTIERILPLVSSITKTFLASRLHAVA
jgi:hypothetical protein